MRTFVKKVFIFSHKIKSFLKKITAFFKKLVELSAERALGRGLKVSEWK